jgi:hypothetical protein
MSYYFELFHFYNECDVYIRWMVVEYFHRFYRFNLGYSLSISLIVAYIFNFNPEWLHKNLQRIKIRDTFFLINFYTNTVSPESSNLARALDRDATPVGEGE